MANITKYDMTDIWASSGDVVAPDSAKIAAGWGVEVVPRQWWNWFENRQDQNIAYMLQKGLPEWDATTEYQINKSYVQHNGIVYKATATSINSSPTSLVSWVRAFVDYTSSLSALGTVTAAVDKLPYFNGTTTATTTTLTAFARTILDDTTAAAVRTTIGAQALDPTLTALAGVTTAVNKLPYFSGVDVAAVTDLSAFGRTLIDDADAAAARSTLGLGTAATKDEQTSTTDTTAGRLLRVGAFALPTVADVLALPAPTASTTTEDWDNIPGAGGWYTKIMSPGTLHAPTNDYYYCLTATYFNNRTQIAVPYGTGSGVSSLKMHMRSKYGASWTPWVEMWHSGNLVKQTSVSDATAGAVLTVGAFGLGGASISEATDCNNAVTNGYYIAASAAANKPAGTGGASTFIHVLGNGSTSVTQTALDFTTTNVYTRKLQSGVWSSWVQMWHSGNTITLGATATTAKTALSLENVDNTSDANKPVSTAQQTALNLKANLASPTFTGVPLSTTAALNTNTTQIATTAFVLGQAATVVSPMNGVATVGTSTRFARQDHVHASDTSRLPLAGGTMTGEIIAQNSSSGSKLSLRSGVDGIAATEWMSFLQSSGTRDGYVGVPSSTSTNVYLYADTGDVLVYPNLGSSVLYEAGLPKLQTTGTGVTVTGTLAATAVTGDGSGLTNLDAGDITAGTLPVVRGGTGVATSTGTGNVVLSDSPALTGAPTAPTATAGTNTAQVATTAFVLANGGGIGAGQTWQSVIGSRALSTTYTNSTGKPIMVAISVQSGSSQNLAVTVAGLIVANCQSGASTPVGGPIIVIVPDGATYSATSNTTLTRWTELR